MANLTIQNEDLLATLQAQRNEAWDAAARAGAACAAAGRTIDRLTEELEKAYAQRKDVPDLSDIIQEETARCASIAWEYAVQWAAIDEDKSRLARDISMKIKGIKTPLEGIGGRLWNETHAVMSGAD